MVKLIAIPGGLVDQGGYTHVPNSFCQDPNR